MKIIMTFVSRFRFYFSSFRPSEQKKGAGEATVEPRLSALL